MVLFLSGFIFALFIAVPVFFIMYRLCTKNIREHGNDNSRQLEELSRLTGGLAHEIKNPLSTIKINLKLITEDAQSVDTQDMPWLKKVAVVQKESERLEHILDDFLRYVGRCEPNFELHDINAIVSDMVDFYSPQTAANAVTIRTMLHPKPLICNIDQNMLKQVILNLLINARQAMSSGGDLIVKTDVGNKNARIEITDTGCGIESEKLNKIFQAYYTSKPAGSGLGLPTARKIINAHKGFIQVTSQPQKGSCFTISLPLHQNSREHEN